MTIEEKEGLIKTLQEHINKVATLPYEDYKNAEALHARTMFLYRKYFKGSVISVDDLQNVNFRSVNVGTTAKAAWDESHGRLLSLCQFMLDELQLPPGYSSVGVLEQMSWNQVKIIYAVVFFIISSIVLWSFNSWAKWGWLTQHPKRLAIYLSIQFALFFISLLYFTNNKKMRSFEWLGVVISVAVSIASMIVSSVA